MAARTRGPSLVVIAGPNGAGKSTAAPALLRDTLAVSEFVNADVIAQGLSAFDPLATAMTAGRLMLKRIHLVFFWLPDEDFACARVAARVQSGGHSVPEDTIRRRYRRGLVNFFDLYRPLATTWRTYDNPSSRGPRCLARGANASKPLVFDERPGRRSNPMSKKRDEPVDIDALFEDGEAIDRALQKAAREARRFHKAMGHSIPDWRDGKVVWIPPEEIVVDPEDEESGP